MIIDTLEISWHDKKPVLSLDFHRCSDLVRIATAGADNEIRIWKVLQTEQGRTEVEFLASLTRHNGAVNVVRFSPCGSFLASSGDDASIILWKLSDARPAPQFGTNQEEEQKEHWVHHKMMRRGHREDVYDLCWSTSSDTMLSASVDNTAILWDVAKGEPLKCFTDAQNYVQGVAIDPLDDFLATMSSDRFLRIYGAKSMKCMYTVSKLPQSGSSSLSSPQPSNKPVKMFADNANSFFRRLSFSPDGALLVVPCGRHEGVNTTYVFPRNNLQRPIAHLPGPQKSTTAVSFCPIMFQLRPLTTKPVPENQSNALTLPYRMVFAVASQEHVVLYDTQEFAAIAAFSSMHFAPLTDLSWSKCGSYLAMSSTDGYCSFIRFNPGELGQVYVSPQLAEKEPS